MKMTTTTETKPSESKPDKPTVMNRLFLLGTMLLVLLFTSCNSPQSVSSFYRQNKGKPGVRNMTIPGWLIYAGTGIAHDIVKGEEEKMMLELARKVKKLQFMYAEEENPISPLAVQRFIQQSRQDNFEDLIYVRDESTTVNVMVREKKDKLRHLVFLVNDGSDFVFLNIRSNIKMKDISKIVNYFMEKEGWKGDEEKNREKKKKEAVPQV